MSQRGFGLVWLGQEQEGHTGERGAGAGTGSGGKGQGAGAGIATPS